mmetsp:Transcript_23429/g.41125  ORF Transcript_23429/g.41125 Transcript_23429/m.41125 type:complete len:248 (-) Transcript_23429:4-747(-)
MTWRRFTISPAPPWSKTNATSTSSTAPLPQPLKGWSRSASNRCWRRWISRKTGSKSWRKSTSLRKNAPRSKPWAALISSWKPSRNGLRNKKAGIRVATNGWALRAPRPLAPMATIPKACASGKTHPATSAPPRSGTSASSKTSTTPSSWAPATSRWRSNACAAGPAMGRRTNWTSTAPSAPQPSMGIWTSKPDPSGAMRSRCCSSSISAVPWIPTSRLLRSFFQPPSPSSSTSSTSIFTTASMRGKK